jgi:hypothetical protein
MFKVLVELGARLDVRNRQGFLPVSLAAEMARKEVFNI